MKDQQKINLENILRERNIRKKNIIDMEFVLISFIFSLAIIFFVAIPEYKQVKVAEEQKRMTEENIRIKEEVVKKVKNYNSENESLKDEDLEKLKDIIPKEDKTEEYIANINKIANSAESRVVIEEFLIKEEKASAALKENSLNKMKKINLSFSLRGDFNNFMSFLDVLERSVPLVNFDSIEIASIKDKSDRTESGNNNKNITAFVKLSFYFL